MGTHVYGNPITEETLKGMPEYEGKEITSKDLAKAALKGMEKLPPPPNALTMVRIYNATGGDMTIQGGQDWSGMIQPIPSPTLKNGQWVVFNHVADDDESSGAIVYRGQCGFQAQICDWMVAWDSILHKDEETGSSYVVVKTYCEVREQDHFTDDVWEDVYDKLSKSRENCKDEWNGCVAIAKVEGNSTRYGFLGATFALEY